jgi:hypothetical protein
MTPETISAIAALNQSLQAKDAEIAALKDANETMDLLVVGLIQKHSEEVQALRAELAAVTTWKVQAFEALYQAIYHVANSTLPGAEAVAMRIGEVMAIATPPSTDTTLRGEVGDGA